MLSEIKQRMNSSLTIDLAGEDYVNYTGSDEDYAPVLGQIRLRLHHNSLVTLSDPPRPSGALARHGEDIHNAPAFLVTAQ